MVSIIFGQIAAKLFSKKQTKQFQYGSRLQPNLDITPHMAITARVTRELSREYIATEPGLLHDAGHCNSWYVLQIMENIRRGKIVSTAGPGSVCLGHRNPFFGLENLIFEAANAGNVKF